MKLKFKLVLCMWVASSLLLYSYFCNATTKEHEDTMRDVILSSKDFVNVGGVSLFQLPASIRLVATNRPLIQKDIGITLSQHLMGKNERMVRITPYRDDKGVCGVVVVCETYDLNNWRDTKTHWQRLLASDSKQEASMCFISHPDSYSASPTEPWELFIAMVGNKGIIGWNVHTNDLVVSPYQKVFRRFTIVAKKGESGPFIFKEILGTGPNGENLSPKPRP